MFKNSLTSLFKSRNSRRPRRGACRHGISVLEVLETRQLMTVYVIDPVNGTDMNPGTLELPFRTPRNLSYSTSEGNSSYHQLQAGDTVYLRDGVHDWSQLLASVPNGPSDSRAGFMLLGVQGTESAPVIIQAYPGERPIITGKETGVENDLIYVLQSSHVKILGLEVTGAFGNGIRVTEAQEIEIAHNHVHDNDGLARNNHSGIYTLATLGLDIHNNLVHDNYDREGARINDATIYPTQNSRNIVIFGDESDRVHVHHNKVFNTPLPNGAATGAGIWVKHASEIPGATFEFYDNIVRDVFYSGIGGQSAGIDVSNNLIINAGPYLLGGGDNLLTKQLTLDRIKIDHNTFVDTNPVEVHSLDTANYPDSGFMEFRNNIVSTNEQLYNSENGVMRLDVYGTDDEYRLLVTPRNLQFGGNVYHNTPADPIWNVFSANGGEYGTLGGNYTFPQWQALGIDSTSVVANPLLSSDFVPQNSAATNAGWLSGSEPRLVMYVQNDLFRETDGQNTSSITLFRTGMSLLQSLTVSLTVSDSSEISVPASVTFPAGVSQIPVPIATLDDDQNEPTRAVQIHASTVSGLNGSEWVRVLQDDGTSTLESPTITAPNHVTAALRPTIAWTSVTGATSYELSVSNLSTGVANFHQATVSGTSYTPTSDFGIGSYSVRVRAADGAGNQSAWTADYPFTINTRVSLLPITRTQPTARPTVQWQALKGAAKYDLWLNNVTTGQTQIVRNQNLTATAWSSTSDLPLGVYRVWVRGIDATGSPAAWSFANEFNVVPAPVVTAGQNSTFDRTPTFAWNAVTGAAHYEVYIRNMTNGVTTMHDRNVSGTSWTSPAALADGPYRWWAIGVSSQGFRGQWTAPIDIYIGGRPYLTAPTGSTNDRTPTFLWKPVDGAASYHLWVNRLDVPANAINLQGIRATSYTPTTNLAAGTYRIWVRAISTSGQLSPWSSFTDVRVTTTDQPSLETAELLASAVSDQANFWSGLCHHRPFADESDDTPSLEIGAVNANPIEEPSDETVMTASPAPDKLREALPQPEFSIVASEESDAAALASIMENVWSCLYEPFSAPTPSA